MIDMRTLMSTLGISGSPLPGIFTTVAGVPWQAAFVLSILGLAAATALAWRSETNRHERFRLWASLMDKKAKPGQTVDWNDALEDALAPPRQVARAAKKLSTAARPG